jgi:hypothetical protein
MRGPVTWPALGLVAIVAGSAVAYYKIERERRLENAMGKIVRHFVCLVDFLALLCTHLLALLLLFTRYQVSLDGVQTLNFLHVVSLFVLSGAGFPKKMRLGEVSSPL